MNNISQDKEKLLKLLQDLEEDYLAEKISDEEYENLSNEYKDKLSNITAVDRIRAMQGKKVVEKPIFSFAKKQKAEKSKIEDEKLVDQYVVKTKKEKKKEPKPPRKGIFAAIAIICLAAAFITGIGFGIFNFDFQSPEPGNSVVTLDENALPEVTTNNTNQTNQTNQTNSSSDGGNTNNNTNNNKKPGTDPNKPESGGTNTTP